MPGSYYDIGGGEYAVYPGYGAYPGDPPPAAARPNPPSYPYQARRRRRPRAPVAPTAYTPPGMQNRPPAAMGMPGPGMTAPSPAPFQADNPDLWRFVLAHYAKALQQPVYNKLLAKEFRPTPIQASGIRLTPGAPAPRPRARPRPAARPRLRPPSAPRGPYVYEE